MDELIKKCVVPTELIAGVGKFQRPLLLRGYIYDHWERDYYDFGKNYICNPKRFTIIKNFDNKHLLIKYKGVDYKELKGKLVYIVGGMGNKDFSFITTPNQTEELLNDEKYRRELNTIKG